MKLNQDQHLLEEAYKKVKNKKMPSKKKKMMKEAFEGQNYSGYELLELWMDKKGVRFDDEYELTNLIEVLGYRQGLREFFGDNPGAIEALFNWISENIDSVTDWKDNLRNELERMMGDEKEEEPPDQEVPLSRQL